LVGKAVLITGGASGIGASHVEHFCEQGSKVGFLDIDANAAAKLIDAVTTRGYTVPEYFQVDLRDVAQLRSSIEAFQSRNGNVEILLNNAAHDERHQLSEVTVEYWDDRIAVNFRHLFFAAQAVAPGMVAMGGGSIINFGSFSWRVGMGGMPVYVAAKAGIEGLTRGLARDLGRHNIRVNCIIPGWVMTQRQLDFWVNAETEREIEQKQCLPSKVYPADIARMALWLAAEDSRMCTSQTFVVDGGWS
jgi:NAD(P)-dependent dehydrogenase (short-subunit alcohol dehydrogenase family)